MLLTSLPDYYHHYGDTPSRFQQCDFMDTLSVCVQNTTPAGSSSVLNGLLASLNLAGNLECTSAHLRFEDNVLTMTANYNGSMSALSCPGLSPA